MSYRLRVLNDSPVGFWELNSQNPATYNDAVINYNDSNAFYNESVEDYFPDKTSNSNSATDPVFSQTTSIDILPLITNSSYDGSLFGTKVTSTSRVIITNSTNNYKMFYAGTENLYFGIEFWLGLDSNPSSTNNILTITNGSNTVGQISVNNDMIYFSLFGQDDNTSASLSYKSFKQITSWESQMHIFAYYANNTINLIVNGIPGVQDTLSSNFSFIPSYSNATSTTYTIGPASSANNFVINDLAFYDYILSTNLIKSHMVWATYDSSPQTYVKQTDGYFFDIKETNNMYAYKQDFSDPKNYKKGISNNLIIDQNGMTLKTVPDLTQIGTGTLSTSSSGLAVTGTSSAKFTNFSDYFSLNKVSVLGQINWQLNNGSSPSVILAIEGFNNGEWLYLAQSTDKKLTLYYYNQSHTYPYTATSSVLAQLPATTTSGTYNFGVSFNGGTATIYLSGTGVISTNAMPSYNYSNLNIYFGNEYSNATTVPMTGNIKNVTILNDYLDPSIYLSYGKNGSFTIPFTSNLSVSQIGTWIFKVPTSTMSKIVGSRVTWDSGTSDNSVISTSKNVIVQVSNDYEQTWTQITNGAPATKFADSPLVSYNDTSFRVFIYSNSSSSNYLSRIDNLSISFYNDLSIISDAGAFILSPRQGSYTGDTYSIKKNFFNIMSRSTNFGIKLKSVNGNNSVATITPAFISNGYSTVEFWFRPDSTSSTTIQPILDTAGQQQNIYMDSSMNLYQSGFSAVYVNGISLISGGKTLTPNESYHFVCVYPSPINYQLVLGGDQRNQYFSQGTFGYISIYPSIFTQAQAQSRYLGFLSSTVSQVDKSNILNSSNVIASISEYSGGSTAYNSGLPILSYMHPVNALK